jgi:hypothetical protein
MKSPDKKHALVRSATPKAEPDIDSDTALFRDAVQGVARLPASGKALLTSKHPQPIPRQVQDEGQTLSDD